MLAGRFAEWAGAGRRRDRRRGGAAGPRCGCGAAAGDAHRRAAWRSPRSSRALDWSWRRASYSRLTEAGTSRRIGTLSETEEVGTVDEPDGAHAAARPAVVGDTPSLMNDLPAGTAFGTLVHTVLEHVDTSAADLAAEVRARTV